jgi:hypothetical protein
MTELPVGAAKVRESHVWSRHEHETTRTALVNQCRNWLWGRPWHIRQVRRRVTGGDLSFAGVVGRAKNQNDLYGLEVLKA